MLAVGQLYSTNSGIGTECEAAGYSGIVPNEANCITVAAALDVGPCRASSGYVSIRRVATCGGVEWGGGAGGLRVALALARTSQHHKTPPSTVTL